MHFNCIFYLCYEDKAKMRRFTACCAFCLHEDLSSPTPKFITGDFWPST